jgi:hypothetical protein
MLPAWVSRLVSRDRSRGTPAPVAARPVAAPSAVASAAPAGSAAASASGAQTAAAPPVRATVAAAAAPVQDRAVGVNFPITAIPRSDMIFPIAYYQANPGAYAGPATDPGLTVASTGRPDAPATAPADAKPGSPAPVGPDGVRVEPGRHYVEPSLLSRVVARFQGGPRLLPHPPWCHCPEHPERVKKSTVPPAPNRSVPAEAGDLTQRGDLVERVAAEEVHEAPQR